MNTTPDTLPDDVESLKQLLLLEREKTQRLEDKYQHILEQFRLAQQRMFGTKNEAYPGQGELFDESDSVEEVSSPEQENISYTRNKPTRQALPKDLPREVVVHDLSAEDKSCDACGHGLHKMGEDKSEQLEFIPAQVKVIEHVRLKYSCRACEKNADKTPVKVAALPKAPIPKSIATPSLLSQIITNKFQYALPLYRQESMFKQHGIELNRKTMSEWMMRCAELFKPIIERLHEALLTQGVIHADETTLQVVNDDKLSCYMWVYGSGADSPMVHHLDKPIVLYDYQRSRSGQCARDFLQHYSGYLQVDGYVGYEQTGATLVGCWAHARRKFVECQKAQKSKSGKAQMALSLIQTLYGVEKRIQDKTPDEKYQARQQQAKPIIEKYRAWLDKSARQVPPKSAMGQAIAYSLNQWGKLIRYLEDGSLDIDNNFAERQIKPFVIGRKNWLFANTGRGAQSSANLYSIIQTAKVNGLEPYRYIQHCLTELPKDNINLESLLPWNVLLKN